MTFTCSYKGHLSQHQARSYIGDLLSTLQNLNGSLFKTFGSLNVYFRAVEETVEVYGFGNNVTVE